MGCCASKWWRRPPSPVDEITRQREKFRFDFEALMREARAYEDERLYAEALDAVLRHRRPSERKEL
jgi:hypothetical protein